MFIAWVLQMIGPGEMKISNTHHVPVPCLMLRFLTCMALNTDAARCPTEKDSVIRLECGAIPAKPQGALAHNGSQEPNVKDLGLLKAALSKCTGPQSQAKAKNSISIPSNQCSEHVSWGNADAGLLKEHLDRAGTLDSR